MISGQQALGIINGSLRNEHASMDTVETRIAELSAELLALQQVRVEEFRELARLRVDMIASGNMLSSIDAVERQVTAALKARESARAELDARIAAAQDERAGLEAERETQRQALERAAEALDIAEAATQARLDADVEYQAQEQRTREAERVAKHAEDKAVHSEQEKDEKGQSYRDDPLFMYLWRRGYGAPQYRAWPVTRWLDSRVARLIRFEDARANYARLQEIPLRLREHAEQKKRDAEAAFAVLRALDEKAREHDGVVVLEEARDKEQAALDAIDTRIQDNAERHQQLLERKEAFAAGEDEHYRKAVDYVASELRRDDIRELRRDALATPFPDDDLIVNRMFEREQQVQQLETSVSELKNTLRQQRQKLQELESLRTDFRRRRYDQPGYGFSDGTVIAALLGSFVNGMLDRDSLWRVLEQQQRYRPRRTNPSFGSGGFGRGTIWGGRRGGLGGGFGRGGGGGGFRTGGGF
jgi:tetrahydromethanopterin S-methyltransferase subunit B